MIKYASLLLSKGTMNDSNDTEPKEVCLSFTGGKDSTLTLHLLSEQPSKYKVTSLVTFTPVTARPFLAHPQPLISLQAESLSLPHSFLPVTPPYLESYRSLITSLNVPYFATGDILDVCNQFMDRVVENTDIKLLRPLWEKDRNKLMDMIFSQNKFEILITCVNLEKINEKVARQMVGNMLTRELYENIILRQDNVDGCGEMGEYHSMVLNAPLFKKKIVIRKGEQKLSDDGKFLYFVIDDCSVTI